MIVIGVTGWTGVARLVRGEFLKLRQTNYVEAAWALGSGDRRIILKHMLPNALAPVACKRHLRGGGSDTG